MKHFYAEESGADWAGPFSRHPLSGIHGAARGIKKAEPLAVSDMDLDDEIWDEFFELLNASPGKGLVLAY